MRRIGSVIEEELLDVFQVLLGQVLPGILVVLLLVKDTIPLGLGLGHRGDFAAGAVSGMAGFAGFLEQMLALARVAALGGQGRWGDESCKSQKQDRFDVFLHDLVTSVAGFMFLGS